MNFQIQPVICVVLALVFIAWLCSTIRFYKKHQSFKKDVQKEKQQRQLIERRAGERQGLPIVYPDTKPVQAPPKPRVQYLWRNLENFKELLMDEMAAATKSNLSLETFTEGVLLLTGKQLNVYRYECRDKTKAHSHVPMYWRLVMQLACESILTYADNRSVSGITYTLLTFAEKFFHLDKLGHILNRHKVVVSHEIRRRELSRAFLNFFTAHIPDSDKEAGMVPFDALEGTKVLWTWGTFHEIFFVRAIDNDYALAMQRFRQSPPTTSTLPTSQDYRKKRRQKRHREQSQARKVWRK